MNLKSYIRDVPNFPKPGIVFKDITTLVGNPAAFKYVIDKWKNEYESADLSAIVGIESRGFIFGAPLAEQLNLPFVPARKPGKLPWKTIKEEYELEYGTDAIELHEDAVKQGSRVLIVDDLLATGGTALAAAKLINKLGGIVHALVFVIELGFLGARDGKLKGYKVDSLVNYDSE
ncbi:TPA: adenine phosphoribosyltransferase [bacterium]|nr:MAG: adenine phosphoribosyltransferase [Candidatus Hydrogenedentes bacterium CG1_02_42_14]PIU47427.1 MAG: adenine phosphoribosyltransferase [Candidatus Hydrogenedentes bacterium CG07_land_8_20_14_0_80_42_17]HBW47974.1 adenine phosphoribosyltransferase [bacterium]